LQQADLPAAASPSSKERGGQNSQQEDVCSSDDAALTTAFAHAKASTASWSTECAYGLGNTVDDRENTCQFVDAELYPSVQGAVDALNAGTLSCPDGVCIVRSERQKLYLKLMRSDVREKCAAMDPTKSNIQNTQQPTPLSSAQNLSAGTEIEDRSKIDDTKYEKYEDHVKHDETEEEREKREAATQLQRMWRKSKSMRQQGSAMEDPTANLITDEAKQAWVKAFKDECAEGCNTLSGVGFDAALHSIFPDFSHHQRLALWQAYSFNADADQMPLKHFCVISEKIGGRQDIAAEFADLSEEEFVALAAAVDDAGSIKEKAATHLQQMWKKRQMTKSYATEEGYVVVNDAKQPWAEIFKKHCAVGSRHLNSDSFTEALLEVHAQFSRPQCEAIWAGYAQNAETERMGLKDFFYTLEKIGSSDMIAAEFADMSVEKFRYLGRAATGVDVNTDEYGEDEEEEDETF